MNSPSGLMLHSKKTNIAFFIGRVVPGGAEIVTLEIVRYLLRTGHRVSLICFYVSDDIKKIYQEVEFIQLPANRLRECLFRIVPALRKIKAEVLISSLTEANIIVGLSTFFYRFSGKVIYVEHGVFSREYPAKSVKSAFFKKIMSFIYNRADGVVAVSNGLRREFIEYLPFFPRGRIKRIWNPIICRNRLGLKKPILSNNGKKKIVTIGRLVASKNINILIKAVSLVSKKIELELYVLGDGPLKDDLVNLSEKLGISDNVHFVTDFSDPFPYFAVADLFLFVPTHEAFGLALLEAMASGLKIISSDVPYGPAEILNNGEFGALVPLDNLSSLPDLIYMSLVNGEQINPDRLSKWLENFDIENIGGQYAEFIDQVLAGHL